MPLSHFEQCHPVEGFGWGGAGGAVLGRERREGGGCLLLSEIRYGFLMS